MVIPGWATDKWKK